MSNMDGWDYFQGFRRDEPHPRLAATGSEGRCELCGLDEAPLHTAYEVVATAIRQGHNQTLKEGDIFTIPAVYVVNPVISPEERQAASDAATAAGLSLSDYLRERGLN